MCDIRTFLAFQDYQRNIDADFKHIQQNQLYKYFNKRQQVIIKKYLKMVLVKFQALKMCDKRTFL